MTVSRDTERKSLSYTRTEITPKNEITKRILFIGNFDRLNCNCLKVLYALM